MFQPISFNVIRQALAWHNLPVPTLRQLSLYDGYGDNVSAEYLALWAAEALETRWFGVPREDGDYYYTVMLNHLRDCFCDDIHMTELHWDPVNQRLAALLYVKVDRTLLSREAIFGNMPD